MSSLNVAGRNLALVLMMLISSTGLVLLTNCSGGGSGGYSSGSPAYGISGTVTLSGTGLAGVTMTLSGASQEVTSTDAGGKYGFTALANGNYTVTPTKTGYTFTPASSVQNVNGTDITGVNFTATVSGAPTFTISGKVTLPINALPGVTMTLSGAGSGQVSTDAAGNYSFTGLANGSYTVTPSKTGYTFAPPTSSSETVNGADIASVDFTASSTVLAVPCPVSGATATVTIQDFSFTPQNITVAPNKIVKWVNTSLSFIHTATSTPDPGIFDSSDISPGATVCFQFTAAGTFTYQCTIHPSMTGSVTVQ